MIIRNIYLNIHFILNKIRNIYLNIQLIIYYIVKKYYIIIYMYYYTRFSVFILFKNSLENYHLF